MFRAADPGYALIDCRTKCLQHVVVTNANCGYVDMAVNLWLAMRRMGRENLLVCESVSRAGFMVVLHSQSFRSSR